MDWKALIAELQASGLSQKQIGEAVGRSQPAICDIASGKTKSLEYGLAQRLIALQRKRAKQAA